LGVNAGGADGKKGGARPERGRVPVALRGTPSLVCGVRLNTERTPDKKKVRSAESLRVANEAVWGMRRANRVAFRTLRVVCEPIWGVIRTLTAIWGREKPKRQLAWLTWFSPSGSFWLALRGLKGLDDKAGRQMASDLIFFRASNSWPEKIDQACALLASIYPASTWRSLIPECKFAVFLFDPSSEPEGFKPWIAKTLFRWPRFWRGSS
jgi:hypothetical protein